MASKNRLTYRLRSKLTTFITIFIGIISVFIFIYFPQEFKTQKINSLIERAEKIANAVATGASVSMTEKNNSALDREFNSTLQINHLFYLVVTDSSGNVIKAYNYEKADSVFYIISEKVQIDPDETILKGVTPVLLNEKEIGKVYIGFSLAGVNNEINYLRLNIGIISLIFFFGGIAVVYIVSSIITKPIDDIVGSAEKISNGDYTHRTNVKGGDELAVLANSFNSLAYKLEKANKDIENLNRQVKNVFKDKIGELNLEINQRRLAEHSLRQSEEQFRLLFELAPIGMVISSMKNQIVKVNQAFCSTLGYTIDEMLGKTIEEITLQDDWEHETKLNQELLDELHSFIYFEKRFVRKDKQIIYAIAESVLVKDENGKPIHFISQVIDITTRKRVEQELVTAKEKAEESDRLKSAFLAQMSHEIRTPLNIILNAIPLLTETNPDEPDPLMDAVNSAGRRLLRTIDLILNLSSVQTGNYVPSFEEIDLNAELKKLVDEFQPMSREKKLMLEFHNKTKNPKVVADRYTVEQIFQNLIGNALKYTLRGGVDVIIGKDDDKVFVNIKDTGIGMSKEYLENMFTPFSQEDVGHKRKFEGNGLGLALVKKYADLNNLEIKVESEKEKGSTFTIIFDRRKSELSKN